MKHTSVQTFDISMNAGNDDSCPSAPVTIETSQTLSGDAALRAPFTTTTVSFNDKEGADSVIIKSEH